MSALELALDREMEKEEELPEIVLPEIIPPEVISLWLTQEDYNELDRIRVENEGDVFDSRFLNLEETK